MPSRSPELLRPQQDHDRREPRRRPDELRNLDASSHGPATQPTYAGFDDELNPIDDDLINTRGSER